MMLVLAVWKGRGVVRDEVETYVTTQGGMGVDSHVKEDRQKSKEDLA